MLELKNCETEHINIFEENHDNKLSEKKKNKLKKKENKKNKNTSLNINEKLNQTTLGSKKNTSFNSKKSINITPQCHNQNLRVKTSLFSHLESHIQRKNIQNLISYIIHPKILTLTLKYSNYEIVGSILRLKKMLECFKDVIQDYETPQNTSLTRHLTSYLSHQIEYLKTARPLSTSMGNSIRWLKQEISLISIDTQEQTAKEILIEKLSNFIKEKIDLSHELIIENSSELIVNGSTILTYGNSEVLEKLFKFSAFNQNKYFTLIVVDSRPLFEGKKLIENLTKDIPNYNNPNQKVDNEDNTCEFNSNFENKNLKIHYLLINSLTSPIIKKIDYAFLGANSMLSNGHLYSRVGTALIAMLCHNSNIPFITFCETIKFSHKVQLDSVTTNELCDCEDLLYNIESKEPLNKTFTSLEKYFENIDTKKNQLKKKPQDNTDEIDNEKNNHSYPLINYKNIDTLSVLNIMYDLTPPNYITKVVTEFGSLPPSSVPVIIREYKNI